MRAVAGAGFHGSVQSLPRLSRMTPEPILRTHESRCAIVVEVVGGVDHIRSYIMTSVSLELHDLTPESGHELTPRLVSRPPSPEMGYESLVNESRPGDFISRTAALVCLSIAVYNG
jgi:hypothetical protein